MSQATAIKPAARQVTVWKRFTDSVTTNLAVLPTIASVVIFVAMLIFGELQYGHLLKLGTISDLLINNAHLIVLAVALTFVIITGGIDLSVGAVVALSSVAGAMLAQSGAPVAVVIVAMILIGTVLGTISGVLVQVFHVQPFIATLAMMFLGRGLASLLSTKSLQFPAESGFLAIATEWKIIDNPKISNDLSITPGLLIAIAVVVVAFILLHRTRFGRTVYAIGGSENSARLMGLPVGRTKMWVYIISGTLSGVATVIYTSRIGTGMNITGIGWELDAIAAAVIGGTVLTGGYGYVLGSVVGAFVLGLTSWLIVADGNVPPAMGTIITGGILLVFVLLQRLVARASSRR